MSPIVMAMEKNSSFELPTDENEPIPHITKAWTSSFMLKYFIISVREPAMYEIMSPTIISVVMFFIRLLNPNISVKTEKAPMKAAMLTPMLDNNPMDDKALLPKTPDKSITTATPKVEPLLIPNIEGSAKGFLNSVCIRSPETDSAAPAKSAVTACGSLYSLTMTEKVLSLPPKNIDESSWKGILTEPTKRFSMNIMIPTMIMLSNKMIFNLLVLII